MASRWPRGRARAYNEDVETRTESELQAEAKEAIRVAAVGDLHCAKDSRGALAPLLTEVALSADVLALCGDLTDYGLPEEAHVLVQELRAVGKIPVVAVLGNHDYQSGREDDVRKILADSGVHVLDGETWEGHGIGFAGVKGFIGGFGRRSLQPWGERAIKTVVDEAVSEALKLESALARLRSPRRIALLHYSPIHQTIEGEPPEITPFLGSSRLEEPLNRYSVTAVFHGHAHHGRPEGLTSGGVPVYNVAMALLRQAAPDKAPFRLLKIPGRKTDHDKKPR